MGTTSASQASREDVSAETLEPSSVTSRAGGTFLLLVCFERVDHKLDLRLDALFQPQPQGVGPALRRRDLVLGPGGAISAVELRFGYFERLEKQGPPPPD